MNLPRRTLMALTAGAALWPAIAGGQTRPDDCSKSVSQPTDVSLHLSIKDGQTVFHEGEIIALTAEYSSETEDRYRVNNRAYDRSGRLSGMEVFCLEPDSGADPLADYFNSMPSIGGGMFGNEQLTSKPRVFELELNEWRRLPPGSYRLSVVGHRVTAKTGKPFDWDAPQVPLRSNSVEFAVEKADAGWQTAQLLEAVSTLDASDATDEEKQHAARVLRFLGSEAAAREMARRYQAGNQPSGWDFRLGLFSSPYREQAVKAMKAEIRAPEHPVTREYVDALVGLEELTDEKHRLPPYDEAHKEAWQRTSQEHWAQFRRRETELMAEAAAAVDSKTGQARAVTASELLQSRAPETAAAKTRLRKMLIESWNSLSVQAQNELLEYRWAEVGGPEWQPALESIVAGEANPNRDRNKASRGVAMMRMYEIAPEEGRRAILKEIAAPKGDVYMDVLGMLPDKTLPQIEPALTERLKAKRTEREDYALLDRYATGRMLDTVKANYEFEGSRLTCDDKATVIRYFLRVSPEYGVKQMQAADVAEERNGIGCSRLEMQSLKEYLRVPAVEKIAVARLNGEDNIAAEEAAAALQHYGSAHAEAALWKRLEKLHEKWKDQPEEAMYPQPGAIVMAEDSGLEQALVLAIEGGQGWFADEGTMERLKALTSQAMQSGLDSLLDSVKHGEYTLNLGWWPAGTLKYDLGWYSGSGIEALKQKLAQFPAGSRFALIATQAHREAHAAEYAEIEDAMAASGQRLEIQAPQ